MLKQGIGIAVRSKARVADRIKIINTSDFNGLSTSQLETVAVMESVRERAETTHAIVRSAMEECDKIILGYPTNGNGNRHPSWVRRALKTIAEKLR